MAETSRKVEHLKLRQGWRAKVTAALILGLAFLLCAKASSEKEEQLEGPPRVLRFLPVRMFGEWAHSRGRPFITSGPLKGIRAPCEEEPTLGCMVCKDGVGWSEFKERIVRWPEFKRFVVLNCGHWMCEDCIEGAYKDMNPNQPALSSKPGQLIEIKCLFCREASEYVVE